MRRPRQRGHHRELDDAQRRLLARDAVYEGSGEHKDEAWWGGLPAARQLPGGRVGRRRKQTTTICPLLSTRDRAKATRWVREAIILGQYKFVEADQRFPKKIWYRADGKIWYGFCINTQSGQYKGWPIDEEERRAVFG